MSLSQLIDLVLGLGILVPLSNDLSSWRPSFHGFHLRFNYFFYAIWVVVVLFRFRKDRALVERFKAYVHAPATRAFLLMAGIGFLGALKSEIPGRSWYFLIWSAGTFLTLPFFVPELARRFQARSLRAFFFYVLAQSFLVITDAAICLTHPGKDEFHPSDVHIGRVMLYQGPGGWLCRPHALYQEPGYFAGFGLLCGLLFWIAASSNGGFATEANQDRFLGQTWTTWFRTGAITTFLSVVATTSRMGWVGVAVVAGGFVAAMAYDWLLRPYVDRARMRVQVRQESRLPWIAGLIGVAVLAVTFYIAREPIRLQLGNGILAPAKDSSMQYRNWRRTTALRVALANPWIGAGPGASGAYYIDHFAATDSWAPNDEAGKNIMRHDPLALDLYSEVLSEWGFLGGLFYFAGIGLMLWNLPSPYRWICMATLVVVYLSGQTLPRFDLWFVFSLLTMNARRGASLARETLAT